MESVNITLVVVSVVVILLGFAALLVILRFFFKLLRSLLRGVLGKTSLFGASLGIRLLSLAGVSFLFPRTVHTFVRESFYFVISTFNMIVNNAYVIWEDKSAYEYSRFKFALNDFLLFFRAVGAEFYKIVQQFFANIYMGRLLLLVGLWICFCYIFVEVRRRLQDEETKWNLSWLGSVKKTAPNKPLHIVLLAAILLIGSYFGLTAIIAVPWLTEPSDKDVFAERLTEFIAGAQLTQTQLDSLYPTDFKSATDPFSDMTSLYSARERWVIAGEKGKKQLTKDETPLFTFLTAIDKTVQRRKQERALTLEQWRKYAAQMKERTKSLSTRAINNFKVNTLEHLADRETAIYLRNTLDWYQMNLSRIDGYLKQVLTEIEYMDWLWRDWADRTAQHLQETLLKYDEVDASERTEFVNQSIIDIPSFIYPTTSQSGLFSIPRDIEYLPNPPEPGSGWGTLGIMSRWLLKTRSFDLVLIIGMVGFGLIGSVIGLFIPAKKDHPNIKPAEQKINFRKILRGFYAAVILFLSVQAGSEIFLDGDYRANPYTLFWFCLVGAAFGEVVWENALKQLFAKIGGSSNSTSAK